MYATSTLCNWSFGDYFKEGAIDMAWEYLTGVLKLNPADLYVTVFEGSKEEGLERDNEAAGYWAKHNRSPSNDSVEPDSSFVSTPGTIREIASTITIAGSSPPVKT